MKRLSAFLLGFCLLLPASANGFVITRPFPDQSIVIIVIQGNGEVVPFSEHPAPFNVVIPIHQGPDGTFAYQWTYEDKQYGSGGLSVAEDGSGAFRFKFSNGKKLDGDTFTAAATLLDNQGQPLHTFWAKAGVNSAGFSGGAKERRLVASIQRAPDWWRNVAAVQFRWQMVDSVDDAVVDQAIRKVLEEIWKAFSSEGNETGAKPVNTF